MQVAIGPHLKLEFCGLHFLKINKTHSRTPFKKLFNCFLINTTSLFSKNPETWAKYF